MLKNSQLHSLAVAALAASALSAGCGDDGFECDIGTEEVDGRCVPSVACGQGTAPQNGECVPIEEGEAPTIAAIAPTSGLLGGGEAFTLTGSGFLDFGAGDTEILFGGSPASFEIASDSEIVGTVPRGAGRLVDVTLRNENGDAAIAFEYTGLFAADGKEGAPGNLYLIDPRDGTSVTLGAIASDDGATGHAVAGLAFDTSGVLFAAERAVTGSDAALLTIDIDSAAAIVVGPLSEADGTNHPEIEDIAFSGSSLLGWSQLGDDAISIDRASGAVTLLGDSGIRDSGGGLAALNDGTLVLAHEAGDAELFSLDPTNGSVNEIAQLPDDQFSNQDVAAMTVFDGTLFALLVVDFGTALGGSLLVSIDPGTGEITPIGELPPGVNAIASNTPGRLCTENGGDSDGDTVCDDRDFCAGDNASGDSDGDGICDAQDLCAGDNSTGDSDGDTVCDDRDACEGDDRALDPDADGLCGDSDNCPAVFNPGQEDEVFPIGVGDACRVVFVKADATGAGDGSSWPDAFTTLEAAIEAAQADLPEGPLKDIWIASGTYRGAAPNAVVFEMVDGLAVFGGFKGTEGRVEARPSPLALTVLDGDHLGNDVRLTAAEVASERDAPNQPTRADNAPRVVVMANDTLLDGLTVAGGYVDAVQNGIGITVPNGTTGVVLRNLIIRDNVGAVVNASGAGLHAGSSSAIEVYDSELRGNIGWNGAGAQLTGVSATFHNSEFRGNGCIGGQGSGIRQRSGSLAVFNSHFVRNQLNGNAGGAFQGFGGTSTFTNVLFDANRGRRGAILADGNERTFINVTVANHPTGGREGAIQVGQATTFVNALFFGNSAGDFAANLSGLPGDVIGSCGEFDLATNFPGGGNVVLNGSTPELSSPFAPNRAGELRLANAAAGQALTSACVDAGDSARADERFPEWRLSTTRTDGVFDGAEGDEVDPGFHFGL